MSSNAIQEYAPLEGMIIGHREYAGELTLLILAKNVVPVCQALRQMGFNYLSDITASDHFSEDQRFELSYNLVNLEGKKRLRVSCMLPEENPTVDTVCEIWPAATWFERECWDMMGIRFSGHPDHRRIFMPEDFEYFPLRKEFPLLGIPGSIELPEKDPPKPYK